MQPHITAKCHHTTSTCQWATLSRISSINLKHAERLRCHSLPSIREFIQNECPVKGIDGIFREQMKAATLTTGCIPIDKGSLVVPGQRQLFDVTEQLLQQIIDDQGQVLLCCFEDSSAGSNRKLATPNKGSWACLAHVAGLQRLPGSSRAMVRVLVADRVAVQAVDASHPDVIKAQSALLRDRWAYFVRTAALEQHLASSSTSSAGSEVTGAAEQVQDAADELMQIMQQLTVSVQAVLDAPNDSQLQQLLEAHEAGDELQDLLTWCQLAGPMDRQAERSSTTDSSSSSSSMPADLFMLEKAWRLSFAPFAAKGLAAAVFQSSGRSELGSVDSVSEGVAEALEMTDLGLRLEAALELAQGLRSSLAAHLAILNLKDAL